MRSLRRIWLAVCAVGLLATTACSVQPLYVKRSDAATSPVQDLSNVYIVPLSDRNGQILHNLLRDRLNPQGQPAKPTYLLRVIVSEETRELAIRRDETATRADLKILATYTLTQGKNDEIVLQGDVRTVASYNILESQFATYSAEQDARKRGLRELSDKIRTRLGRFFVKAQRT